MALELLLESAGLLTLVTFLLTQGAKYFFPKWGDNGKRLFVILVAFLFAVLKFGWAWLPAEYAQFIAQLVATTTGFYVIVWKWIGSSIQKKIST